ncbi:MAG TPA: LysE family translocator [Actinopolymorphaceae bacterium]|nr:LysE family translocator [Actinopolymorphaceae bacterium]
MVKLAGAGYLFVLGVLALLSSRKRAHVVAVDDHATEVVPPSPSPARAVATGLFTSLTNPKVALFWLSVLPQFVDLRGGAVLAQALALGLISFTNVVAWLTVYAHLVGRLRDVLRRPRVRRIQERVLGCLFVGLGARLAIERGP